MSIRSGDIRDQSRKLSEIARKFGRFWPSQIFGAGLPKVVRALSPVPRITSLEKFLEDTPTSSEDIEAHTLNFKPNFKFSRLIFLGGGTPVPVGVCAR